MRPPRSLRQSLVDGVTVWLAFLLFTALLGFTFGGWTVPTVPEPTTDWLATTGGLAVVTVATSFVVVGAPVAFYERLGLVTPLLVAVLAFGWFAWTVGLRAPAGFDAVPAVVVLYSWLLAPLVVFVAFLEHGARRMYRRTVSPVAP
ncbi:hypothetical protein [Halomarina oriensis]|uniref:Uncharacterized protein n=1 Tax=Halomarina oriensis TaxID=671145 RepID=A0A6B0GNH3_9EURY|nr:hypothetical protein [Halomarina oriensis]MWG35059.1 hypothetical protein [Halomarina oriensis]